MRGNHAPYIAAVAIASFLGGFGFLAGTHFVLFNAAWCIAGEEHCVREWIGALSGWAGAFAAAITLFALYEQLKEQRKQTDFAVGNADPTLTVIQDIDDAEQVVVRVVNWNRRGLLFVAMDIRGLEVGWLPMEAEIARPNGVRDVGKTPFNHLYLRGWEDRNKSPEVLQIKIAAAKGEQLVTVWPDNAYVSVEAILIAERHERFPMRGHLLGRNLHA